MWAIFFLPQYNNIVFGPHSAKVRVDDVMQPVYSPVAEFQLQLLAVNWVH